MQKFRIYAVLLGTILAMAELSPRIVAQEAVTPSASNKAAHEESIPRVAESKPGGTYKLEFTLSELENGKKINSRNYSMLTQAGGAFHKLRIGGRVPVAAEGSMFQYLDMGMNIDCRVQEQDSQLVLGLVIDSSHIIEGPAQNPSVSNHPVVRQLKVDLITTVSLGKPTVVANMDDPGSNRQFQVEITATKPK